MHQFRLLANLSAMALFALLLSCASPANSGWERLPEILDQIKAPQFADKEFNILEFGAIGNGQMDCSDAFAGAISACHQNGGGRVIVPAGAFLTGPIHLLSNVNLHVTEDATILFSQDPEDYLPVVFSRWEGVECFNYSPFIYAYGQENIAITGSGTLDGQADPENWWPWKGRTEFGWQEGQPHQAAARQRLFEMAEHDVPVAERIMGQGAYLRPQFIQPYNCKNILIEGVTITNSPMWEINPVLCENVTVQDVIVTSHGPNNDGCDPESCKNVLIKGCYFDTGDDCIALKSGRNADGRRVSVPIENVVIQDCQMKDGHGGVVIGSEISGNARNIFAENCTMDSPNLDRVLRIKTNSVRGGVVENVFVRDIVVGQVADAVLRINFNYEEGDAGEFTPSVRNVHLENVVCDKSNYAVRLEGYQRSPIADIVIKDCSFNGVDKGNVREHVENIRFENVRINGSDFRL
jgi:polygalacturonase